VEINRIKEKRVVRSGIRRILWSIFIALLILTVIFAMAESLSENQSIILGVGTIFLAMITLVILYIIAEKFYNWPIIFFIIFFTGIFFKRQHWPLATLIGSAAIFMISVISLANSIRFLITLKKNAFLKWFGSISGLIITLYMLGWIFMLQNWPRAIGDALAYSGAVLFIISILGMVFTLPSSNFISWSEVERKSFFRMVLIPMVIVFGLIIITFVFEDGYRTLLNADTPRWHIEGMKLFELEGIPKI
jgi:hypothetical protein